MAAIRLVEKIPSQFTMVLADFHFRYRLLQGEGDAEEKSEYYPHSWKVDVWHDCRVTFFPSGCLEARPDGEIQIERGYVYKFEWIGEAPEQPAPAPPTPQPPAEPPGQPEPSPGPVPPVLPDTWPNMVGIYGSPVYQMLLAFWGDEAVFTVPEAWYREAWAAVREKLIERINDAIQRGEYRIEYHIRQ